MGVNSTHEEGDFYDRVKTFKGAHLEVGTGLKAKPIAPLLQGHSGGKQMLAPPILVRSLGCEETPNSGFLEVLQMHSDSYAGFACRRVKHMCRNSAQAAP